MDVNGTRFHMVLGRRDWEDTIEPPIDLDVCFDERRRTLGLRPQPFVFPTRPGAARLAPGDRRGAAVDRFGNHFWISPDRHSLLALGAAFDDGVGSGGQRFTYAMMIAMTALLWSLFAWAVSYGLRLLDHIDLQQRNGGRL